MNRYPLWKYLLIAFLAVLGVLYALPNIYGDDPAVQISPKSELAVGDDFLSPIENLLKEEGLQYNSMEHNDQRVLVRFADTDAQLKAADIMRERLTDQYGEQYSVALNLAPSTPGWLRSLGADPMVLGLDLQGGVHFLMQVDMDTAREQQLDRYVDEFRSTMREERIRYKAVRRDGQRVILELRNAEDLSKAFDLISRNSQDLLLEQEALNDRFFVRGTVTEAALEELRNTALQQNITTLRNRVNELGVAEPVIQQQGLDRIVVQLPGVQDTARAKEILRATASLEYRLVDTENDAFEAQRTNRVPPDSRLYTQQDGSPILLKRRLIVSGDQLIGANSGFDPSSGTPSVTVTLDGAGAARMLDVTLDNVGKPMAVVFIEYGSDTVEEPNGETRIVSTKTERVISVANIREPLSKRFQTTGLQKNEADQLALLLRAGALAAPVNIIEERTVGPSLGKDNISKGFTSVQIAFILVLVFMAIYYRLFGLFANVALLLNLVFIVAVLSLFGATLTLPGIAGIVLTVGMAVDANVLIFERIREELRNGNSPHNSIRAGYQHAFSTIVDANITTFIAALALFAFGTGPIKGFAVTLSIGILTSMFSAIMVTRALVNLVYGGKARLEKVSI
ncbi:MAG: protein translocase subunit SecD [Xanthomonadales bacterium]|jgi:preprotein translocase subunit SecD|nr:protein translocase subunit SecD [Xanthomonadales bacterium]